VSFFDSLDRTERKKMRAVRVAEGRFLRLIGMLARWGYWTARRCWSQSWVPLRGRCAHRSWDVSLHDGLDVVRDRGEAAASGESYPEPDGDDSSSLEREDDAHGCWRYLRSARAFRTGPPPRTRRGSCPVASPQGQQVGQVRPPSTFWASRALGRGPEGSLGDVLQDKAGEPQRAKQALYDWVVAIGTNRSRHSTPRSVNACEATSIYVGVSGNFAVCCGSSKRRSGPW